MKRLEGGLVVVLLVFLLGIGNVFADSSSTANAGASANASAGAASFASGGSASAHVSNVNVTAPEIKVGVSVNPGQEVSPETTSRVEIDSHAVTNYKYINRQFFSIGMPPIGGTMQDFLPPSQFGYPWNFSRVIEGNWKKQDVLRKIKVKKIKEYCYRKMAPQKKVVVLTNHQVLVKGKIVGELKIKGTETEDSTSIQMAAIDKLASWGANIVWIRVNALEHEAKSSYSGFILGSGVGGVMAAEEKVASSGSGGIGKGSSKLSFLHYPVVQAVGYYGKIIEVKKEKEVKEEEVKGGDGKKWQAIQP